MATRKSTLSNVIPLTTKHPGDALYDACERFGEARAALVVASEILSDSAFSGGNAITEERDCCAILLLEKGVKQLSALQAELDTLSVALSQPKAIAKLKAEREEASHG